MPTTAPRRRRTFEVVVETPRGSSAKLAFDPDKNACVLRHVLPLGMAFPYDFGFVPGTLAEDGDPVDVVILSGWSSYPGVRLDARLIGALLGEERQGGRRVRNDRLLVVPTVQTSLAGVRALTDLPGDTLRQLEDFFETYTRLEGKSFRVTGRAGPAAAAELLARATHGS
jgi:inorganic pyrophosphatase